MDNNLNKISNLQKQIKAEISTLLNRLTSLKDKQTQTRQQVSEVINEMRQIILKGSGQDEGGDLE